MNDMNLTCLCGKPCTEQEIREMELELDKVKKKNCDCKTPVPSGNKEVGEYEGNYERCLKCIGRIWS